MVALNLISGRLLAKNVVWNLVGAGLPLFVALWAIPVLINGLGTERFGLLSIIMMGVGYFSLFDLGVGRALTKLVAERLGNGVEHELPRLIRTGLKVMFGLGVIAAVIVFLITPWATGSALNIPDELQGEAYRSFWILAFALPFVISTAGLIGVLQAYQRFPAIAAIRIPLGISNFLGPVLILSFTSSLIAATAVLAILRIAAWGGIGVYADGMGSKTEKANFDWNVVGELLTFGGWITVTNVVGPLMVYFDRFMIGALLTLTLVAYYTTPYEVITRLWVIPEALAGVLFPALTTALAMRSDKARQLTLISGRTLILVMLPPVAFVMLFAPEGLALWLGREFSHQSTGVLRWLAVGVFVNCLARLPSLTLQSVGRPDLNAKLHVAELIPYVVFLWFSIKWFGIVGAAAAWTLRILFDTVGLYVLSMKVLPELRVVQGKMVGIVMVLAAILGLLPLIKWTEMKFLTFFIILMFSFLFGYLEFLKFRRCRRVVVASI